MLCLKKHKLVEDVTDFTLYIFLWAILASPLCSSFRVNVKHLNRLKLKYSDTDESLREPLYNYLRCVVLLRHDDT
jgi:hypothetical protein